MSCGAFTTKEALSESGLPRVVLVCAFIQADLYVSSFPHASIRSL